MNAKLLPVALGGGLSLNLTLSGPYVFAHVYREDALPHGLASIYALRNECSIEEPHDEEPHDDGYYFSLLMVGKALLHVPAEAREAISAFLNSAPQVSA